MTKTLQGRTRGLAAMPLLALVLAGAPLAARAQQDETPAPTPAPAPSTGRTIDFRLPQQNDGRASGVQGPADNGLPPLAPGEQRGIPTPAPTPAPPPVAPRIVPTQPTPSPTPAPTPAPERRTTPTPAPVRGAAQAPTAATPETSPAAPKPVQTPTDVDAPANDAQTAPPPVDVAPAAGAPDRGGTPLWAWALALLAAAGAGFWYWRRRPALAGDAPDEPVGAPPRAPVRAAAPRAVTPPPPPARAPQPAAAAPRSASPLVTRPAAERRAQIAMALGVRAIRVTAEHVAVGFTIELRNDGPLAATGLMVRIALGQGSAMQEAVIARFFDGAGGSVLRDGMDIAPGATETLNSEASLPRGSIEPLMIGGKPALVPVLVLDVTYHWDGDADAFGQTAGAYVLGRAPAAGAGDRLAPLPLDRPVYSLDRPAARATAARRTQ